MNKGFLYYFSIYASILGVLFLANYTFLYFSYELTSYQEIIDFQSKNHALYGSALNNNDIKYKLELASKRQSDFLIIGSSRAMQFREESFNTSMTNCGGVFSDLDEGIYFIESLLKTNTPKKVLLTLDYWWFERDYRYPITRIGNDEELVTYQKIISPFEWLLSKRITPSHFIEVVTGKTQQAKLNDYIALGVHAFENSSGFRYDGSYLNGTYSIKFDHDKRQNTMKEEVGEYLKDNNFRVKLGLIDNIPKQKLNKIIKIIKALKEKKIDISILIPPIAPMMLKLVTNDHQNYTQVFRHAMNDLAQNYELTLFDYTSFGNDEDFLDIWHPGELLNIRILNDIADKDQNFNDLINRTKNDWALENSKNKVLARFK